MSEEVELSKQRKTCRHVFYEMCGMPQQSAAESLRCSHWRPHADGTSRGSSSPLVCATPSRDAISQTTTPVTSECGTSVCEALTGPVRLRTASSQTDSARTSSMFVALPSLDEQLLMHKCKQSVATAMAGLAKEKEDLLARHEDERQAFEMALFVAHSREEAAQQLVASLQENLAETTSRSTLAEEAMQQLARTHTTEVDDLKTKLSELTTRLASFQKLHSVNSALIRRCSFNERSPSLQPPSQEVKEASRSAVRPQILLWYLLWSSMKWKSHRHSTPFATR